jgi:hypothetical protein
MKPTRHVYRLSAAVLAIGLGAATAGIAAAGVAGASPEPSLPQAHALFVQTDTLTGNSIQTYARGADGSLTTGGTYATGGLGGLAAGATADPLASQGSLALTNGRHTLLAVNAGSNTVSVFSVDGTKLHLDQVVRSGGLFPVSIAVHGFNVAVLNAGGSGSVAEFVQVYGHLYPRPSQTRSLGLADTNPPFFTSGPGQVGYTPDGSHLVVTDKHSTDAIQTFRVSAVGALSPAPVSTPSQTPVPFAFNFDSAGRLVVTEAGTSNVSTYSVNTDGSLTPLGTVTDGAKALCWISTSNGFTYGSNAGSGTVSSFTIGVGGVPVLDQATAATTHPGTTDSLVAPNGSTLYVESGGSGLLDAFHIAADGTLTPAQTIAVPVASEGLAVS